MDSFDGAKHPPEGGLKRLSTEELFNLLEQADGEQEVTNLCNWMASDPNKKTEYINGQEEYEDIGPDAIRDIEASDRE